MAKRRALVDHMGAPLGSLPPLCPRLVLWRDEGFDQVLLSARNNHPLLQRDGFVEKSTMSENTAVITQYIWKYQKNKKMWSETLKVPCNTNLTEPIFATNHLYPVSELPGYIYFTGNEIVPL